MKLSQIAKGTRAIRKIPLPLVNVPSRLSGDQPELIQQRAIDAIDAERAGEQAMPADPMVGVRVLLPSELAEVYERAAAYAKGRGVSNPDEQNPIYNLAVSVYLCAAALVDAESDPKDPEPFAGKRGDLESAALELFSSPHLGGDALAYLADQQQTWQDLCSPRALRVSPLKFFESLAGLGDDSDEIAYRTFLAMRPGMQWRSARSMAVQLRSLLGDKWPFGSALQDSSPSSQEKSELPS